MSDGKNPNFLDLFDPLLDRLVEKLVPRLREKINGNAAAIQPKDPLANKRWLFAEQAAAVFGMSKTWFEGRGRKGEITTTKAGRRVLFERQSIEELLERHKKGGNNGH